MSAFRNVVPAGLFGSMLCAAWGCQQETRSQFPTSYRMPNRPMVYVSPIPCGVVYSGPGPAQAHPVMRGSPVAITPPSASSNSFQREAEREMQRQTARTESQIQQEYSRMKAVFVEQDRKFGGNPYMR